MSVVGSPGSTEGVVGEFSAYYGLGAKVGFDVGINKYYAGVHLYTVQKTIDHRGIETVKRYTGVEVGGLGLDASFLYNWGAYHPLSVSVGLGPLKLSRNGASKFSFGGYLYALGGVGLDISSDRLLGTTQKDSHGYTIPHSLCFIAGSKVLMCNGTYKNIENVIVSDSVLTYDFGSASIVSNCVTMIDSPMHKDFVEIEFSNGIINTNTQDHPYYVINKGWCAFKPNLASERYNLNVKSLDVGDECFYFYGNQVIEMSVKSVRIIDKKVRTYNLTGIEGANNYFVNGILVNNENAELNNIKNN